MTFDLRHEMIAFSDFVAPMLDVYEQAIFVYLLRHSHIEGSRSLTIGLKSSRHRIGLGSGDASRPMSESTLTKKILSLESKGLIERQGSGRSGTVLEVKLPSETGYANVTETAVDPFDIETFDFFEEVKGRAAILEREGHKCFYCFARLDSENYVMEHVVSRPEGNGSYRNIVAACRSCNNSKSERSAETHLRNLLRSRKLADDEFQERLEALDNLKAGRLVPLLK